MVFHVLAEDPPEDVWSRADLSGELADMARRASGEGLYAADPLLPFDAVPSKEVFEHYRDELLKSIDCSSPKKRKQESLGS